MVCRKISSALLMALLCTAALAAGPSFNEPFRADARGLLALRFAEPTATSESSAPLSYLATEQATSFAKGARPTDQGAERDASKAGLPRPAQPAMGYVMSLIPEHENYALMLSGIGVMSILAVRRRRLDCA